MESKVKWGVIGSGGIARRRTIPEGIAAASNARLVAVHDIDPSVNGAVARQFEARAVGSIQELLQSGVDAVYIATPAFRHHEQVIECTRARKHVLCEKPLGLNVREAEELKSACASAGVRLGVGFMMRFQSQHRAALELVREGRIGKPVYCRAQLSCWYPPIPGAWRQVPEQGGGGSLIDMGGHCIDLLEMFFGPVRRVTCFINNAVQRYAPEDSAVATLFFESGAMGTVDAFFCIPDEGSKNVLELYGSEGSILARGTVGQGSQGVMRAHFRPGARGYAAEQIRDPSEGVEIAPAPLNVYRAEIEEFSQAILDGRESSINADGGVRSQKILAACYESARTGRAVDA